MPEYSFAVPDLGAKWFSNAFLVQLAETEAGGGEGAGGGGEVLDADAAALRVKMLAAKRGLTLEQHGSLWDLAREFVGFCEQACEGEKGQSHHLLV